MGRTVRTNTSDASVTPQYHYEPTLVAATAHREWTNQPLPCHDRGVWDWFYPERGGHRNEAAAKALCATCPAKAACLAHALEHGETHGVWGGTTPDERADITKGVSA